MKNKIRAWFSLYLAGLFLLIGVPLILFSLAGFHDVIKGHLAGQAGVSKARQCGAEGREAKGQNLEREVSAMPKTCVFLLLVTLFPVIGCFLLPADPVISVQGRIQVPELAEDECTLRIIDSETGDELAKRSIGNDFFVGAVISPFVSLVDIEISCMGTAKVFWSKGNKTANYRSETLDLGVIDLTNGE